ncbi:NAD(P)-binding protein [Dichomitus squalens]|uniref:NAD(P)-binding protein n=2 Tax=Dichomitus squalens TaxID=114155 RepID=A0A4Q9NBU5_9APHY|nr:NAD(P)-binding protein [Dichomitus squalens LYAD-421 SS1]EJF59007.1 NAD(P)-binding protein [Dichomitus squalens LYAD-421 SS1]TBU27337.1 NAD(P)-binding protein [Dichomitus squalens]TBU37795.1 NAD(P)-binding protein [Dichomitus squalens]TBU55079.1 NAD(P)-binding protein [Dichomitus squalens]
MPVVTSGKVLVTGANGFVAAWVVKDLLDHGYSVRGTVRSEGKAPYLREFFKSHGDKFEVVIVEDITKEGAFDAAVSGVDAILHIASPVTLAVVDPDEVIQPAVRGTTSVLSAALRPENRATIKRVVIMSSSAAVYVPPDPGHTNFTRVLDERDWNTFSLKEVEEKGKDANGLDKYRASKTLAERKAWEIYEAEKTKGLEWDLVTLQSPFIFGPIVHEAPSLDKFGGSPRIWYDNVVGGKANEDTLTKLGFDFVDVRDLARAHVLSLTVPEAAGQRFIIRASEFVYQQFVDAARKFSDKVPVGYPSYNLADATFYARYSNEKSKKVLGLQYRSLEETTKDTIVDFESRGWL